MRYLACLFFIFISPAFGASDFYEAFDFKRCLQWGIDNEPRGSHISKESKEYMAALELANRQPHSWHKIQSWDELDKMPEVTRKKLIMVYSAGARDKTKNYIEKFGACHGNPSIGITCLPNQDFPLAGSTYQTIKSKGELTTFKCIRGCKGTPEFIYDMGYENMEDERNIEHEAAQRRFSKVCGRSR